ncbi:MAG: DUF1153 domain-containing protein, partial [Nitrospira sp.]|nr:DUF1153 domain-containing protein [Nitrospira sp.]
RADRVWVTNIIDRKPDVRWLYPEVGKDLDYSEQGAGFGSDEWNQLSETHGLTPSRSCRGYSDDYAAVEFFLGSLTKEKIQRQLILLPSKLSPPIRHNLNRRWTMTDEPNEPIQRWTAKRRLTLVMSLLKGETTCAEAARAHGLTVGEIEEWRERFLAGAENALRARPKDEEALKDEQIKKLKQKIGDLVVDNDVLREALKPYPLARGTSDA